VKGLLIVIILVVYPFGLLFSQIGGEGTYQFVDLTNSARVAGLGGVQVAFTDNDLNLVYYNPSLLSDSMRNQLSLNYVRYLAGIGVGYVSFAPNFKGRNVFAAGIHYVNYGTFEGASETGVITGTFKASEYAINLYYSRTISSNLRAGVNIKPIFSFLENYHSIGFAADLGITGISNNKLLVGALVVKNMGRQITTYYENGEREKLPFNVQLGFSKRLANAPVRFYATFDQLNNWNIVYSNTSGDPIETSLGDFSSILMSHLILGGEIYPQQYLTLRFGYNYRRQKELAVNARPGLVGFSAGVGVKIGKFAMNYGIASFHLAETAHYFSLSTSLSQFIH